MLSDGSTDASRRCRRPKNRLPKTPSPKNTNARDTRGQAILAETSELRHESCAGSGQGGPCLTDAARGAASGRAVRGLPLRRGPNDAAAILAAKLARWRHGLSFSVLLKLPRRLRAPETMQVSPCSPFRSIPTGLQHVVSGLRARRDSRVSVPAENFSSLIYVPGGRVTSRPATGCSPRSG